MAHTGAARAGVVNLTKSLSIEWSSYGVRVNAIAPSVIASSGLARYPPGLQEIIRDQAQGNNYAGRLGTEEECAAAILFLFSPASAFTTGVCLNLDAGESIYSPLARPDPGVGRRNVAWVDQDHEKTIPEFLRKTQAAPTALQSRL